MIRFFKTPWIVQRWYPSLTWSLPEKKALFLTFDDGPNPEVTPWVMDELDKAGAKATFFCEGRHVEQFPQIVQNVKKKGHAIGNHGNQHLSGWSTNDKKYLQDIIACDNALDKVGIKTALFRPPYGRIKKRQIHKLQNKRIIMWTYVSWDFDYKVDPHVSISRLKQAKPGDIIVFHDSPKAFDRLKIILPEILSYFDSKGLKFEALIQKALT